MKTIKNRDESKGNMLPEVERKEILAQLKFNKTMKEYQSLTHRIYLDTLVVLNEKKT